MTTYKHENKGIMLGWYQILFDKLGLPFCVLNIPLCTQSQYSWPIRSEHKDWFLLFTSQLGCYLLIMPVSDSTQQGSLYLSHHLYHP